MQGFSRGVLLLASASLFSLSSYAKNDNQLIIINHFDKPLQFTININPQMLPDFPSVFTMNINDEAKSRVIDIQKESYIRTEDLAGNSGFWGVDIENNKTHIHGYRSKGVAYSWKEQTIVFCTPEEYKEKGSCL